MDGVARGRWVRGVLDRAVRDLADQARAEARVATRCDWVRERIGALKAAQRRADDAWVALLTKRRLDGCDPDEDDKELDPPLEQAELDQIWAEIDDVRKLGRWPRALYWGLI